MCKALDDIWLDGKEEGELSKLISLIMKKYHKGKSVEMIADEVEEPIERIRPIYELIECNPKETEQGILQLVKLA